MGYIFVYNIILFALPHPILFFKTTPYLLFHMQRDFFLFKHFL